MKKEFLIGVVLAGVVLAAVWIVPGMFTSVSAAGSGPARQAELARRELSLYNGNLTQLSELVPAAAVKSAEPSEKRMAGISEGLAAAVQDINSLIQHARKLDKTNSLPDSPLPTVTPDANGLRNGLNGYEKLLTENSTLLANAAKNIRDAAAAGGAELGVAQVAGMVKIAEATDAQGKARRLRTELAEQFSQALSLASDWRNTRAAMTHYQNLDSAEVAKNLESDVAEVETDLTEARAELDRLGGEISKREADLATVQQRLGALRIEMNTVEQRGFQAGNDSEFASYRDAMRRLADEAKQLQSREHMLVSGGLEGGKATNDGSEEGGIDGGTPTPGLEVLKRKQAAAQENVERLARSRDSLQKAIAGAKGYEKDARDSEQRFSQYLQRLLADFKKVSDRMDGLEAEALKAEDAAIAAAKSAINDFDRSKSAISGWKQALSTKKNEFDSAGRNERLKFASQDSRMNLIPEMAKAEAQAFVGRALAERLASEELRKATIEQLMRTVAGSEYKKMDEITKLVNESREGAISYLNDARRAYDETLARNDSKAAWLHQLALASVALTLAKVDGLNAAKHKADATAAIQAARKLENSPHFAREFIALTAMIDEGSGGAPTDAPTDAADVEKPAGEAEGG